MIRDQGKKRDVINAVIIIIMSGEFPRGKLSEFRLGIPSMTESKGSSVLTVFSMTGCKWFPYASTTLCLSEHRAAASRGTGIGVAP